MRPFIEFDPDVDAGYIRLTTAQVQSSEEIAPGVVLDFDKENQLVGVEVLSVHRQMDSDIKMLPQEIQDYIVLLRNSVLQEQLLS
ncbi:DUF2283 domain-containing protein [Synechococcus sp. R55.6]|jgi:uncharacterized protein YuzE|uniref:DUF2283 domain-containing protein n=1 Tax=unclassified Synechococcus TaxID=2626047 RepID=UPI0000694F27|nr:DUF2283 domain-containing protein [Synechococcus sp. JA-2-3B'a(2-13)]ABD02492.1 conserved hypothetical protein [Synechococcus sp. JA-2-3B'a(2-13)]